VKSNPNAGPPGGRGRSEPAPSGDGERAQLIQVATRCATLDEFVERFAAFAWEGSLVLPAASALPVGTQGRFVVLLRDKTVAMRGRCRVTEAKQTPASRNPAVQRIMMRVALLEMDEASRAVHRRLIALRSAPVPLPIPPEPSETTAIEPARQAGSPGSAGSAGSAAAAPAPAPASVAPAPPVKTPPSAPPVNLNRTIIGVGIGPDGRAFLSKPAAAPAPAPVPPEVSEPTVVNEPTATRSRIPTLPRNETRAPGASYTLPANPLSEFGAADVDSFIECTLLEADVDTGTGIAEPPPLADAGGGPARRETAHVRVRTLLSKLPPSLQGRALRVAPYALVAVISIVIGYRMRGTPPAAPPVVANPAPAAPAPAARATARVPGPEIRPLEAKVAAPVQKASPPVTPTKPKAAAAPKPAPEERAAARPKAEAVEKSAAPDKAVAVAKPAAPEKAVAAEKPAAPEKVVAAEKPAAPEKVAAVEKPAAPQKVALADKPAAPQRPAAVEKVAAAPEKTVAVEKPAPDEKPAPAAAAPTAAAPAAAPGEPGACTARVVTEPKDAKVIWNDQVIGRSPIEGARVPCGPARVTIDRERWQTVTLDVNAQVGNAAVVHERLRRPRGTLIISSSPPGAQITVNRIAAGTAPKEVDVQRFEKVPVKVTLKGHQPWNKTIYLKESELKLDAQLVPRK